LEKRRGWSEENFTGSSSNQAKPFLLDKGRKKIFQKFKFLLTEDGKFFTLMQQNLRGSMSRSVFNLAKFWWWGWWKTVPGLKTGRPMTT